MKWNRHIICRIFLSSQRTCDRGYVSFYCHKEAGNNRPITGEGRMGEIRDDIND